MGDLMIERSGLHRAALAATAAAVAAAGLVAAPGAQAQVGSFSQLSPITFVDNAAATPYPSSINVSGLPKGVTDVNLTLKSWDQLSSDATDVLLVGPGGQAVVVLSDVGSGVVTGLDLVLDDEAANSVPAVPVSGTWKPTNVNPAGDAFPAPAPATTTAATLAGFDGTDPNGVWSLYVVDDDGGMDTGNFDSWTLQITTADVPAAPVISTPTNGLDSDGDFILAGNAQASSTVKVYEGTTLLAQTAASTTGTWALALLDQTHGVHAYTATATDSFGNVSAVSAVKSVAVDTVDPRVIRTRPGAGADEVRRGRNVRAFFSEPVRPVTIVGTNVKLVRVATGGTVRARIRYDADTKTVVINPRNDLAANARYKVVIGTGVRDLAGNRLDQNTARSGNQPKVWRFRTR